MYIVFDNLLGFFPLIINYGSFSMSINIRLSHYSRQHVTWQTIIIYLTAPLIKLGARLGSSFLPISYPPAN